MGPSKCPAGTRNHHYTLKRGDKVSISFNQEEVSENARIDRWAIDGLFHHQQNVT